MQRLFRRLFSRPCEECGDVRVLAWRRRCAFCDHGEGLVHE